MSVETLTLLSKLPYNAIDFKSIEVSNYMPALREAITKAKTKLAHWKNEDYANIKTFLQDFTAITDELTLVSSIFYNMHSANVTEALQAISQEFSSLLTQFQNDFTLDLEVFEKVKKMRSLFSHSPMTIEEHKILEKMYDDFVRNGANLNDEDKNSLRKIDEELASLSLTYSDNVLKSTKEFCLQLSADDLLGLPESLVHMAKETAQKKKLEGYVITLDSYLYVPFMKHSQKRNLREKIYRASVSKATTGETNNLPLVKKMVDLRHRRAQLLGFKTHAEYVLAKRMAKNSSTVTDFLHQFKTKSKKKSLEEFQEVKSLAQAEGLSVLEKWDVAYYSERIKEKKYQFDDEMLRPYFSLEKVLNGVFDIARKLYGLTFKKNSTMPTYDDAVEVYEVYDQEKFISLLYLDLFPRDTKKSGAWMTSFMEQGFFFGEKRRPHIGIVCNFPKPTDKEPSLLTWGDVVTYFHEFGHALHGMLSQCEYTYLSGTNVYWDFVELPSQLLENWARSPECLEAFAKHYKTQEVIPVDLVKKVLNADQFQSGLMTMRQISFGSLDMAFHAQVHESTDPSQIEALAMKDFQFLEPLPEESMCASFSHIFSGGYSAGYYSYKWAEVLDADAFSLFQEKGIFNKEVSTAFRQLILEKGGTEDPAILYEKFRSRSPSIDPLLTRLGIN
jgi:peptidyl-dipeptidase Dcp